MKVAKILERSEKKVFIDMFLPEECQSFDEQGNLKEVEYITIKKIPYSIKQKMKFVSMNTMSGETGKHIFKLMKQKKYDTNKLESMTDIEKAQFMLDMGLSTKDSERMTDMTIEMVKLILDYGVDKTKHSFVDQDDKPITLDYNFWNCIGNEKLIDYIVMKIKSFSNGFSLGE